MSTTDSNFHCKRVRESTEMDHSGYFLNASVFVRGGREQCLNAQSMAPGSSQTCHKAIWTPPPSHQAAPQAQQHQCPGRSGGSDVFF